MIFNLTVVVLMATFSTFLDTIWAGDRDSESNSDGCIIGYADGDDGSNSNSNIQRTSSTVTFLGSKRKPVENSTPNAPSKNRRMYYHNTSPINPRINEYMAEKLAKHERLIYDKRGILVWENIMNLQENDANNICIEEWRVLAPQILAITLENSMVPDCVSNLVPGPSKSIGNHRYCIGVIMYAPELRDSEFVPDLLRCNCAYKKKSEPENRYTTVRNSKRFFYINRQFDMKRHFVLTSAAQLPKEPTKQVKFVNVRELKDDEFP